MSSGLWVKSEQRMTDCLHRAALVLSSETALPGTTCILPSAVIILPRKVGNELALGRGIRTQQQESFLFVSWLSTFCHLSVDIC